MSKGMLLAQYILYFATTFKLPRNLLVVDVFSAKLAAVMTKRAKLTPRQVLDEIFADEDSDVDPDADGRIRRKNRH